MTQRFLVWATQRIKSLFIKIENTGGGAGLEEDNEFSLELIAFKVPAK